MNICRYASGENMMWQNWGKKNGKHCAVNFKNNLKTLLQNTLRLTSLSSVQFSRSVVSDSLQPHELQHSQASLSITNSQSSLKLTSIESVMPSAISSSVAPFSSCPQSLPASESFPMSQLFASGDQSTAVSDSKSVLPMNTQGWSPLGWTGWISL